MRKNSWEETKNEFKSLCDKVLPEIKKIEEILNESGEAACIRLGNDGYMSFEIHNSEWRMTRYKGDKNPKIYYEHSEEIKIADESTGEH